MGLGQTRTELSDRHHAAHTSQLRRQGDREDRRQLVTDAPRLAVLRHLAQKLVQALEALHLRRPGPLDRESPFLLVLGLTQGRARRGAQLAHQHRLRLAVLPPTAARNTRVAARLADLLPIGRPVTRPRETARVHERLRQQHRVAGLILHVPRQPPQRQTQHTRSEIRSPAARQHQKTRVVGHQPKTTELLLPSPADPTVPRLDLERTRVPTEKCHPRPVPQLRHLTNAAADQTAETQIVLPRHQHVPTRRLGAIRHTPNRNTAQIDRRRILRHRRPLRGMMHFVNDFGTALPLCATLKDGPLRPATRPVVGLSRCSLRGDSLRPP